MARFCHILISTLAIFYCGIVSAYVAPIPPFAPAAGVEGSTAIYLNDERIVGWASHVHSVTFGDDVAEEWQNPEAALGPASESGMDVTVLGRGGEIVLWFPEPIVDGNGYDFAVFENSFSNTFLELAYVEVSSDGVHFVRFPNYSLTATAIPAFGNINPTLAYGYAGKYEAGHGVPFDLAELQSVYDGILAGYDGFSSEYRDTFVANYSYINLDDIQYVRIIDIPGDGSRSDCEGYPIYDPYKTIITAGFDLDAVGVLNKNFREATNFDDWSESFMLEADISADTDGDGWNQYLEYYFGTDPLESASKPEMDIGNGNGGSLLLSFWVRHNVQFVPEIQTSPNGSDWGQIQHETTFEQRVVGEELYSRHQAFLPENQPSHFLRFEITD